jgi:hypothetical protein
MRKTQKVVRKGRKALLKAPILCVILGRQLGKPTADALTIIADFEKPLNVEEHMNSIPPTAAAENPVLS